MHRLTEILKPQVDPLRKINCSYKSGQHRISYHKTNRFEFFPLSVVMPEDVSAVLGSDAEIPCRFHYVGNIVSWHGKWLKMDSGNSATLTIYDSKNPDAEHNNPRGGVQFKGNLENGQCSLLIKDIGKSDEGTYQFIVKINSMASISMEHICRSEVRLSVTGGMVKPSVNSSVVAMEGSSTLLHCTVRGEPAVSLRWVRNGEEISTSSSGDLKQIFYNITAEDDGEYWCVANYNNDSVNSSTQISVQYKPRIIAGPICTISENGTNCICTVRANPPANITWRLNGIILPGFRSDVETTSWALVNRSLVESSLRLFPPTGTRNVISCKAANKHGDSISKFQLHTEDKPRIIAGPICTISENGTNCTCTVRANPPANITWRLNGIILPGFRSDVETTSWALVNRSLVESSLRLFPPTGTRNVISCKATNKHGDSISKFQLHTEENFLWIIVIVVGTIAAVTILIVIVAKVQRNKTSAIACVPETNNDSVTYAMLQHPLNTQSQGLDSNIDGPGAASKPAQCEEVLYAALNISNIRKPEIQLQIEEPSEYAAIKYK
ncbi:Schwann cell myelin protein-like [Scyliorhinus canicula]|uniref:Schwann cell myelin protein-like n=1 Tax=Scyliorhinus canicula TaxID=7830 RepID=UPI0018F74292|nr:Schwann cell myelin protein-like [Scyliorhinus canicula]